MSRAFRGEWTLFKAFGIPVRAHITLVLFVPLLTYLISQQIEQLAALPLVHADPAAVAAAWGGNGRIIAGGVIAIGLFASVLLHELGHAVEARRHHLPVKSITLWIFGGIARLERMPRKPSQEALVAIAGPIVSFGLGAIGLGLRPVVADPWAAFIVAYLGWLNLVLGAFNLLPAFPLDGGRLLRAALAARKPYVQATRIAADVGKVLAVLMGIIGLFSNFFLIFIALFVYMAASQEAQGVQLTAALDPIRVHEVMDVAPATVSSDMHLDQVVQQMMTAKTTGFPVVDAGGVIGVITLSDVRDVDAGARAGTRVGDVMSRELIVVAPHESAARALRAMSEHQVGRLLVVGTAGDLDGVVTRESVMRAFEIARMQSEVKW